MGIHRDTRIQAYRLNRGGARARLSILRMIAAESANNANPSTRLQPGDWRGARAYTIGGYAAAFGALSQGKQSGERIWYSHLGEEFRNERDAYRIIDSRNIGYYTDIHGNDSAIGIIASLPHGRFIAGYWWGDNDERVYFSQVYDDEREAARAADSHAESFAESAREDSARFDRMCEAETACDEAAESLRDVWALRRAGRRNSSDVADAIQALRDAREELETATREYEGA